ncbi:MAG: hypothetical protein II249_03395 [Bacteroidaceae bacterium]|nr:hypothetical protein [Bacteroidaceae bacterium]
MTIDEAISHAEEVAERYERMEDSHDDKLKEECLQCAADHRQLAAWLGELKEAKRLLKMAVEDFKTLVLKSTEVCNMKITCNKCPLNCTNDNLGWKKEAEALKLIGETNDEP